MSEMINEVKVIWVADVIYHPGAYLDSHFHHDYHQIFYMLKNKAEFEINGNSTILSENMIFFARPDTVHGIKPIPGPDDVEMLDVKFIVLDRYFVDILNNIPVRFYGNDQLKAILLAVIDEGLKKDLYFERSTAHLLCSFLYKMIQLHKNSNHGFPDGTIRVNPVVKIKDYIKEHYREEISLSTLAENVGYTKNYICRLFKENSDITINEFLNSVRIHRAVDLLLSSDMDITEISKASGYTNIYHFMKTFKKLTKMSPESYRRNSVVGTSFSRGPIDHKSSVIWTLSPE